MASNRTVRLAARPQGMVSRDIFEFADETVPDPGEGEFVVKVEMISIRTEGKLMFLVPAEITAGNYTLKVCRSYTSSVDVRTGTLDKTLKVS